MDINILAFGIARDIVGKTTFSFKTTEGVTVAQLKQQLLEKYPRFINLASLMIAVNTEYGQEDTIISEDDEIALIPPVAGG
jgi:molybdopterin converting factor subunit 1